MPPLATISPVASPTGDNNIARRPTELIALSESLGELSSTLRRATPGIAARLKAKGEALAQRDALASGGKELADAVRDGIIEPTQNPFYVDAYERQSAAVRGRTALEQLKVESATWEERGQVGAFEDRWQQSLAAISENFEGANAAEGFNPVAAEFTQQTLAQNTALAVQRINQERTANAVATMSTSIRKLYASTGGTLTPEQAIEAVEGDIDEWIGTGGSLQEAEELYQQALLGAAYQVGDENLVDFLKTPIPGAPSALFDRPGAAQELEFQRYRIGQAAQAEGNRLLRERDDAIKVRGTVAVDEAYLIFGNKLTTGDIDLNEFTRALETKGYSPQEIDFASKEIGRGTFERTGTAGKITDQRARRLLALDEMAKTEGYTPEVQDEIIAATVRGDLTATQARAMAEEAKKTSVGDPGETFDLTKASGLNRMSNALSILAKAEVQKYVPDARYSPQTDEWEKELKGVANAALLSTPGSETEKAAAARAAMQAWSNAKVRDEVAKLVDRQKRRENTKRGRGNQNRLRGER